MYKQTSVACVQNWYKLVKKKSEITVGIYAEALSICIYIFVASMYEAYAKN